MRTLPQGVREAMAASGATVTCLPVKLDADEWETAVFFDVTGPECAGDRRVLAEAGRQIALGFEGDLVETGKGWLVVSAGGKYKGWVMARDDSAKTRPEGPNLTVTPALRLSSKVGDNSHWDLTLTKQGLVLAASSGKYKGWYWDFGGGDPSHKEGDREVAINVLLAEMGNLDLVEELQKLAFGKRITKLEQYVKSLNEDILTTPVLAVDDVATSDAMPTGR